MVKVTAEGHLFILVYTKGGKGVIVDIVQDMCNLVPYRDCMKHKFNANCK